MKKKYYLRGLGIGILITALLFVVALVFHKPKLSDAEIRRQARALGMIDAAEVDDMTSEDEETEDTEDISAVEEVESGKVLSGKILVNGQLYLMYEGKMYDVRGARVK